MRDAVDNPFSPGSDVVPQIWAGRTDQLSDWRDVVRPRRLAGLPERGRTVLGEAGLGKSALVRRIAQQAVAAGDWVTPQLRVPAGSDPLKIVATAILELAERAGLAASRERRIADLLARVQAVGVSGLALTLHRAEGPEPYTALTELLVEVGVTAIGQGAVALVHVDEVQNIADPSALSQLLIAFGDALAHEVAVDVPGGRVTRSLPLAVYLTGLPEFEDKAGAQQGATFARRFRTSVLEAIDDEAVVSALQVFVVDGWPVPDERGGIGRIRMDAEAVSTIVDLCRGEPFLLQLAGERAWYGGSGEVITRQHVLNGWHGARSEATAHVERILARLPSREREFVEAMAALPTSERSLSRIAEQAGFARSTAAGPTSQRLDTVRGIIARGRLYSFRHRAVEAYLTSGWPDPS